MTLTGTSRRRCPAADPASLSTRYPGHRRPASPPATPPRTAAVRKGHLCPHWRQGMRVREFRARLRRELRAPPCPQESGRRRFTNSCLSTMAFRRPGIAGHCAGREIQDMTTTEAEMTDAGENSSYAKIPGHPQAEGTLPMARILTDPAVEEWIQQLAASAPPMTEDQRARLSRLLRLNPGRSGSPGRANG